MVQQFNPDFIQAMAFTMEQEGVGPGRTGWVNNPADPGGATVAGVSLAAVRLVDRDGDGRLDFDFDGDGDVDLQDMLALREMVARGDWHLVYQEYWAGYWMKAGCDLVRPRARLPLFDCAVNSGPKVAIVQLQKAVGAKTDGIMGPATVRAVSDADWSKLQRKVIRERITFYARLVAAKPTSGVFLDGWINRALALEEITR